MTCRYRYIHDRHLLLENLSGDVTIEQIVAMKQEEKAQGVGGLGLRSLVDLRRAHIEFQPGQIQQFASWVRANLPEQLETRTALLSHQPLETGLALMYASNMKRDKTVEVFHTLFGALRWLEIELGELEEHADIIHQDVGER